MQGKKTVMLTITGILLCGSALMAQAKIPDVVGIVNGEKITKDQLVATMLDWRGAITVDEIILMKLTDQEAKKAGVVVTPEELNARVVEFKASLPPGTDYLTMLKTRGQSPSRLGAIFKMQLQAEKTVSKNIKVTPQDLAQYREASHILIVFGTSPTATAEEKAKADQDAKAKIDKIAAEIKSKTITFEDAAKKYSEDPGTKDKGGELGWVSKGQMVADFEKTVFSLNPGQTSEPVKTEYGYHIIKLTNVGDKATAADKKVLADGIFKNKLNQELPLWMKSIQEKGKIQNFLSPAKSKPAVQAKPAAPKPGIRVNDNEMVVPPPPPPVR